jgi:cephalosporin hydroxylase
MTSASDDLAQAADTFLRHSLESRYSYSFSWLGRPIIQYPQDLLALQEIIWNTAPTVVVETGVAHGGSAVFFASFLELNRLAGRSPRGRVVAVEVDLRPGNREALRQHPLSHLITVVDGSSTDATVFREVVSHISPDDRVMVVLDSDHTAAHVAGELDLYAPLVSPGSYCVVCDTVIEYVPITYPGRTWGRGNSPATAVTSFLATHSGWSVDHTIDDRLLISVSRGGYLRRHDV